MDAAIRVRCSAFSTSRRSGVAEERTQICHIAVVSSVGMFEFQLAFTVFACDECGHESFAIDPPCACDPTQVLVDENVLNRRRLVWDAAPTPPAESPARTIGGDELTEMLERLRKLVPDIIAAVRLVGSQEAAGVRQLRDELANLRACVRLTARARWLRPWRRAWGEIHNALLAVEDMTSQYLHCLTADSPIAAEARSEAAQGAIDRLASNASEFADMIDLWNLVPQVACDPLGTVVGTAFPAYADSGAGSLLGLDHMGQDAWLRITGSNSSPTGIGAALAIPEYIAKTVMDETKYETKARITFERLTQNPASLRQLLDDKKWAKAYKKSSEVAYDSIIELNLLAAGAHGGRLEIRALIGFGAELFETISQPLLVAVLAAGSGKPVSNLLAKTPKGTIGQIDALGLHILSDGLSAQVRNAASHNDYEVDGDEVTLCPGQDGSTTHTVAELTDSILAGVETVLALHVGVMCALLRDGIPLDDLPGAEEWELTEPQRLNVVLGLAGWTSIEITETDAVIEIIGSGPFPQNPISLGGACLAALDANRSWLILRARSGKQQRTLRMPVDPFRTHARSTDQLVTEISFVEGCLLSTFNERPLLTPVQGRKWIAIQANRSLSQTHTLRKLKALAAFVDRVDYDDLEVGLNAAMKVTGAQALGSTPRESDVDAMSILAKWEDRHL